ncbi:MAG: hypothetical protein WCF70_04140 [Dehalococcoidales bacterium]|jgi:hypothetical protein
MVTNEIVHLLVAPPQTVETSLVKEASLILQKDPYETRMLLSGKLPKLIAHYSSVAAAETAARQLKTLGLVALAVSDIELNQFSANGFNARSVEFEEQAAVFRDNTNRLLKLETKDVFLIIKGKYQVSSDKPVTTTRLKFNLTATLVTGGIPIWSKVKETSKTNSGETGYFVRIYDRDSVQPRVEIFENYFNYSVLGAEIAPSSAANLNSIVTKLRAVFPQALFDDILTRPMGTSESYDTKANVVELNCRLLYWYHRALSNPN